MNEKEFSYCVLFLACIVFAGGRPDLCQVALNIPLHPQAQRLATLLNREHVQ